MCHQISVYSYSLIITCGSSEEKQKMGALLVDLNKICDRIKRPNAYNTFMYAAFLGNEIDNNLMTINKCKIILHVLNIDRVVTNHDYYRS